MLENSKRYLRPTDFAPWQIGVFENKSTVFNSVFSFVTIQYKYLMLVSKQKNYVDFMGSTGSDICCICNCFD